MSHSRVFQLEKIKKSQYEEEGVSVLTEDMVEHNNFPNPNWVDYWKDSEDAPLEDFKWFITALPEGVFEVNLDELSITLLKRPESYVSEFFDKIREESEKLNLSDFVENKCSTWKLGKLLRNNDCEFLVYQEENSYPRYLHDWLLDLAQGGEIGETYYLGGVLDYHY